jgi:hypothetical protein
MRLAISPPIASDSPADVDADVVVAHWRERRVDNP